ncbi:MAG: Hpt domain-containing protein [Deltaproteobacteria bacterium]|nr:Hpt domain-containing protein [Deltaproteobacteria bacterium]
MSVGSHKDAFKAHQLVKKLISKESKTELAQTAADILLDFVKSQRQVKADRAPEALPPDEADYDPDKLRGALVAVNNLCGHCEESHDDGCFVNQARRALIAARTGVDLGPSFDGRKSLEELLAQAAKMAAELSPPDQPGVSREPEPAASSDQDLISDYQEVKEKLEELTEKDIFRATLIDEITDTIARVSNGDFAAEMPVHDDDQLGKLATAFNLMLKTVDQTMRNLDLLVSERSSELRMIMDAVPVGLCSISRDFKVNPEYSRACEDILNMDNLRGRDFLDLLGLTRRHAEERQSLIDFLDIFFQRMLPEKDLAPLNPFREIEIPGNDGKSPKWVNIQYHLINKGSDVNDHILVVLKDITQAKALQAQVAQSERENMQLKIIAEDPDLFCEFLGESIKLMTHFTDLIANLSGVMDARPLANELFRGVHTIKGTAASFGLDEVTELAAGLEDQLRDLREVDRPSDEVIESTKASFDGLKNAIDFVVGKTEKLLGQPIGGGEITLRVAGSRIKEIIEVIQAMPGENRTKDEIIRQVRSLREVSVKRGLGRALKIIPGLIDRLGKDVVFKCEDNGVRIDCDIARELNTPLVHLIRNAFDHGIESFEERLDADKPEQGKVTLQVSLHDQELTLTISDDGRGLDQQKLKDIAMIKGLLDPSEAAALTEEQCYGLIFRPGFSTAEAVTDVSGRGVGMDAALAVVQDSLKGDIRVESTIGQGTKFIIKIPV